MGSYVRNFLAIHFYVDDWWMKFDFMAVVPHITGRLASLVSILQRKALTTASASAAPVRLMGVFLYRLSTPRVGSRTVLFVVVSLERLLASFSKIAAGVSIVGALSAELHSATKAIVLPLCYVLGIPAIVLSVSQTEVLALEQFGQGIQDWDFLIIFGLPLLFVGLLSVFLFSRGWTRLKSPLSGSRELVLQLR